MRRLAIIPLLVLIGAASAAAPADFTVGLGRSARMPIQAPALNIIVGDPAVADVLVIDRHAILVQGKAYGRTQVIALGAGGRPVWQGEVAVVASDSNHVSLHRGTTAADYNCTIAADCSQVAARPSSSSSGGGGSASGAPPRAVSGAAPIHH